MTTGTGSETIGSAMTSTSGKPSSSLTRGQVLGSLLVLGGCAALLTVFNSTDDGLTVAEPPDFGAMDVIDKKREFFAYLSPLVASINDAMRSDRDRVRSIREAYDAGEDPGWLDQRWLRRLSGRYEVAFEDQELAEALTVLERRAGVVPVSLVLAQAAIESGWGTSRFAIEGNNYFGQRCYETDCGIAPHGRAEASFGLAEFDSVADSVLSYMMNLNTHAEYSGFRRRRQALRAEGPVTSGLSLLEELDGYSERGNEYIEEVRAMIRANDLE